MDVSHSPLEPLRSWMKSLVVASPAATSGASHPRTRLPPSSPPSTLSDCAQIGS